MLKRKNSWTNFDDTLLAEVVIKNIRIGNSQGSAFEEAANKLSRTEAACSFRWHFVVKKQFEDTVTLAYTERNNAQSKQRKQNRKDGWLAEEDELLTNTIIEYIKEGKTRKSAIIEASKKLKRSEQACRFRWNSVLRKKYKDKLITQVLTKPKEIPSIHKHHNSKNIIDGDPFINLRNISETVGGSYIGSDYNNEDELNETEKLKKEILSLKSELEIKNAEILLLKERKEIEKY